MLVHRPASTSKIIIFPFQEEHLPTDYLFIWMHIRCTTLWDLLDQPRFWLHTVAIKDMVSICSNHREPTTDIVAVLQVRADKQLRQNSKKLSLASCLLNRPFSTSPKCKKPFTQFKFDSWRVKVEEIRSWVELDLWKEQLPTPDGPSKLDWCGSWACTCCNRRRANGLIFCGICRMSIVDIISQD